LFQFEPLLGREFDSRFRYLLINKKTVALIKIKIGGRTYVFLAKGAALIICLQCDASVLCIGIHSE